MAEAGPTTSNGMGGADEAAHFAKPPSDEEVEGWRRDWRRHWDEMRPEVPPVGNIALALELAGLESGERTYEVQGLHLRVPPVSFLHGLRLIQLSQRLEKLLKAGLVMLKDGGESGRYVEHLEALRVLYADLRAVFRAATLPSSGEWTSEDPFYDLLEAYDYRVLIEFLLAAGDECPIPSAIPTPETRYRRYNAAHILLTYLSTFGGVPGWVVDGRPASWRHYRAAERWMVEEEARRVLARFGAYVMPQVTEAETRTRWLRDLQRQSGDL